MLFPDLQSEFNVAFTKAAEQENLLERCVALRILAGKIEAGLCAFQARARILYTGQNNLPPSREARQAHSIKIQVCNQTMREFEHLEKHVSGAAAVCRAQFNTLPADEQAELRRTATPAAVLRFD